VVLIGYFSLGACSNHAQNGLVRELLTMYHVSASFNSLGIAYHMHWRWNGGNLFVPWSADLTTAKLVLPFLPINMVNL